MENNMEPQTISNHFHSHPSWLNIYLYCPVFVFFSRLNKPGQTITNTCAICVCVCVVCIYLFVVEKIWAENGDGWDGTCSCIICISWNLIYDNNIHRRNEYAAVRHCCFSFFSIAFLNAPSARTVCGYVCTKTAKCSNDILLH